MNDIIKKNGVTFGIILGVYFILRTTIMYSVDLKLFVNGFIGIGDFIVSLILGVIAVSKAKKSLGSFITFKEAFTTYFIAMVIGLSMYTVFNIILFNVIDPGAKDILKQHFMEYALNMMQSLGGGNNSAIIKQSVEQIKNTDTFGPFEQLKGLVISILLYSVVGLIVAAIMKKNKPEFN